MGRTKILSGNGRFNRARFGSVPETSRGGRGPGPHPDGAGVPCSAGCTILLRWRNSNNSIAVDEDYGVDFSRIITPRNRVSVIAAVALTDNEARAPIEPGWLVVLQDGWWFSRTGSRWRDRIAAKRRPLDTRGDRMGTASTSRACRNAVSVVVSRWGWRSAIRRDSVALLRSLPRSPLRSLLSGALAACAMALAIAGPAAAQNGEQPAFAGPYVPTPWVIVDEMMKLANRNATEAGVADRVKFFERDLFTTDVREAGIVTLHTVPRSMAPRP